MAPRNTNSMSEQRQVAEALQARDTTARRAAAARGTSRCEPSSGGIGIRLKKQSTRLSQIPYTIMRCAVSSAVPRREAPRDKADQDEHEPTRRPGRNWS